MPFDDLTLADGWNLPRILKQDLKEPFKTQVGVTLLELTIGKRIGWL
jgi:hypothetical protein